MHLVNRMGHFSRPWGHFLLLGTRAHSNLIVKLRLETIHACYVSFELVLDHVLEPLRFAFHLELELVLGPGYLLCRDFSNPLVDHGVVQFECQL